jgi:hypothetical protein
MENKFRVSHILLQHPFALCRYGFWHTYSVYVQLWLAFPLLTFIANIYTTCFGLIGHPEVYKFVLLCNSV